MSKLMAIEDRPTIEHHDVSRSILKSLVSMKFGLGLMLESDIGVGVPAAVYRELQDGLGQPVSVSRHSETTPIRATYRNTSLRP